MPSTARTQRAVSVATPDRRCRKFSAVRSAASSARASPVARSTAAGGSRQTPSGPSRSSSHGGIERAERRLRGVEPEDDAGRLLRDRRDGARAGRDRRLARDVAVADVLGERAPHELVERL